MVLERRLRDRKQDQLSSSPSARMALDVFLEREYGEFITNNKLMIRRQSVVSAAFFAVSNTKGHGLAPDRQSWKAPCSSRHKCSAPDPLLTGAGIRPGAVSMSSRNLRSAGGRPDLTRSQ